MVVLTVVSHSSLQEISPLAQSFVGGYLLNPYLMPFKEALNLAATGVEEQQQEQEQQQQQQEQEQAKGSSASRRSRPPQSLQRSTSTLSTLWRRQQDYPYKLVGSRNVGMTAIMLFARKPDAIHHIQFAECAFGIADMGNKGAVALRVTYSGAGSPSEDQDDADSAAAEQRTTVITFVATHLAAMEYNLRRRNANWASIVVSASLSLLIYVLANPLDSLHARLRTPKRSYLQNSTKMRSLALRMPSTHPQKTEVANRQTEAMTSRLQPKTSVLTCSNDARPSNPCPKTKPEGCTTQVSSSRALTSLSPET